MNGIWDPRWIRYTMYAMLLAVGGTTAYQQKLLYAAEQLRATDGRLMRLAGMQGSLSQHMNQIAAVSQRETSEADLAAALKSLNDQRSTLNILLSSELTAAGLNPASLSRLERVMTQWRNEVSSLSNNGFQLLQLMNRGQNTVGPTSAAVQNQSQKALEASEALVQTLEIIINDRGVSAGKAIRNWTFANMGLLLLLGLIVVEPTVRLTRRQYFRLIEQKQAIEVLASERERLASEAVVSANLAESKATEDKSLFLAIASHDLRTPLQTILSTVEVMSLDLENEARFLQNAADNFKRLKLACSHTLAIAADLGEFVRDSESYKLVEPDRINLTEFLEETIELHYEEAVRKNLEIDISYDHDIEYISIGAMPLRRIVSNLVTNAVKYTNQGRIDVHTHTIGSTLIIKIIDTGIGIDPDELEKISAPFYRGKNIKGNGQPGLGLGLSIVDKYTKLLNGSWSVKSTLGEGSTITVSLPYFDTSAPSATDSNKIPKDANFHVLVVDDENATRKSIVDLLNAHKGQLSAVGFSDCSAALHELKSRHFDIAFIDLQMQPIDGYTMATQARLIKPTMKIVAMSAYTLNPEQQGAFDGFIAKPVSTERFLRTIGAAMKYKQ